MHYARQSLSQNERIIHVGQFHWLYTAGAVFNAVMGLFVAIAIVVSAFYFDDILRETVKWSVYSTPVYADTGLLVKIRSLHPGIRLGSFFSLLMGLFSFANMMVVKATTEVVVTTSRVIYKRGIVARYVGEISVDRIEGVNVIQTVLGRIFDFGRIVVRGMGVGEVFLPTIENPVTFRKAIDKARAMNYRNKARSMGGDDVV